MNEGNTRKLLEDLKIHQVELETQAEELRRAQQEAQESRDKYLDLYDNAPIGYLTLEKGGVILEANLTAARLLGLGKNDLIHSQLTRFILPDCQDTFHFHLNEVLEAGTRQKCEIRMRRQDGSVFFAELDSLPITDLKGNANQSRTTLSDISERKKTEEQRDRYLSLATIGQLSGGVAHELRNPLATIDSSVFLLEKKLASDETGIKYLKRIRTGLSSCTQTIDALLALTHPEDMRLNKVEMKSIMTDFLFKNEIPTGVEVVHDFPEEDIFIKADERQLRIALRNIITNAVQAMNGKGRLTLSIRENGGTVEASFSDTGSGIASESLGRMFEPLFTTKAKGMGMGLAITRMIVEKQGGTIAVHSEPGKGATFTVRLPKYADSDTGAKQE